MLSLSEEPRLDELVKKPPGRGGRNAALGALFAEIPQIIATSGRVRGFERIRDLILQNWLALREVLSPYNAIKLAMEADKHALLSETAQTKSKGKFDHEEWDKFQRYLRGEESETSDEGSEPGGVYPGEERSQPGTLDQPPAAGRKRRKGHAGGTSSREVVGALLEQLIDS